MISKSKLINLLKAIGFYRTYQIPLSVTQNYTKLSQGKIDEIDLLASNYCKLEDYSSEKNRQLDITALSFQRLNKFRSNHIPFLHETIGLQGKSVLEIGCGSGASSVCLSEQGAIVTGIDVDATSLEFARSRAEIYSQDIRFLHLNGTDLDRLEHEDWDVIIYFASLEHMTPRERKTSLSKAFSLLKEGSHLCVFGTPNRLWPIDIHTSYIPFYMWLQDELALDYARFSSRKEFSPIHNRSLGDAHDDFYRWGRGCSYHEFHQALGSDSNPKVVGSLPEFLRRYTFLQRISYKRSLDYKYRDAISKFGPEDMHPGFYECYLDIIVEK